MSWRDLSDDYKNEIFKRYSEGEDIGILARESGMNMNTLGRRLREIAQEGRACKSETTVTGQQLPSHEELFGLLKTKDWSMKDLCNRYDRSPETINRLITGMKDAGYVIEEVDGSFKFKGNPAAAMEQKTLMNGSLAERLGQEISFLAVADLHAGSDHSQPTAYRRVFDIAYNEYGVRVAFHLGDITTGVGGYRGQEHDLVPALRLMGSASDIARAQVWLANEYTPEMDGLTHYAIGGNHDQWCLLKAGLDPMYMLASQRKDFVNLGYDLADVPLTDKVDMRLWHPGGGGGAGLSNRLQKAVDQGALEELRKSVVESTNPRMKILLAGHMHTYVTLGYAPFFAAHVGCFEGQTNYLKRKALYPQIGGCIFKIRFTDGGMIERVDHTFLPFAEVEDDWKNWPIPPAAVALRKPDQIGVIFKAGKVE